MAVNPKLILASVVLALLIFSIAIVSDEPARVIASSEILQKIRLGMPIEYDHVIVKGNLSLSRLDLLTKKVDRTPFEHNLGFLEHATLINSSIRINDSVIDGGIEFDNSIFQNFVNFENTRFSENVDFKGSEFKRFANFKGARFSKFVDFRGAKFGESVDLSGAKFNQASDFSGADLGGGSLFWKFQFNQTADMAKSRLMELVDFGELWLNNASNFIGCQLEGFFNFARFEFIETANFILPKLNDFIILIELKLIDAIYYAMIQWNWFANFVTFEFDRMINIAIPLIRDFAIFIGLRFNETSIFVIEIISRSGKRLEALATCSAIFVVLFGILWRAIGLKPQESSKDKYGYSKGLHNRRDSPHSKIQSEIFSLLNAFFFSAKVFFSGIKLFVDTPRSLEIGRSRLLADAIFNLERAIGALFLILFFVAIIRV